MWITIWLPKILLSTESKEIKFPLIFGPFKKITLPMINNRVAFQILLISKIKFSLVFCKELIYKIRTRIIQDTLVPIILNYFNWDIMIIILTKISTIIILLMLRLILLKVLPKILCKKKVCNPQRSSDRNLKILN